MDLIKSLDFFNPLDVKGKCHIIGCGSVGSSVAELLVRLGITNISLYDFDNVSSHNLANQMFFESDVEKPKTVCLKEMLVKINPDVENTIELHNEGWTNKTRTSGYIFMCVDNIDLRREIAKKNQYNQSLKLVCDFRTGLTDAQSYLIDWGIPKQIANFFKSMEFTHEEAKLSTPLTACNVEMGVAPTVRIITSLGVANFMNFINKKPYKNNIIIDAFNYTIATF